MKGKPDSNASAGRLIPILRIIFFVLPVVFPELSLAYQPPGTLTFRHTHRLFFIPPGEYADWKTTSDEWTFEGQSIKPPAEFRADGDKMPSLPSGVIKRAVPGWDLAEAENDIKRIIADVFDRPAGEVSVTLDASGSVIFDGVGITGLRTDLGMAAELAVKALEAGITDIILPVEEIQPKMNIDKKLREIGIKEVVSIGESNFSGSPRARRHNISTGLSKFNGTIIGKGEDFSFNKTLGPVNGSTGYKKELVILGERTLPDYGGGLCQISTTAYRGVWEYGFPITQRRNHSFAVRYYGPSGTDATIYPPHTDMRFLNDSPGAILIQTFEDENDNAYFIYYGTRDGRTAEIIGPYTWDMRSPPPDRTEYTDEIPPGTTRKVGEKVPGLKAMWYRIVNRGQGEVIESVYSLYEARPNFTQIGVSKAEEEMQE